MKLKNKKAGMFMGVIVAITLFIAGILFLPFITDDITTARNDIDCTNTSISDGAKLTCLQIDLVVPYFIWFLLSISLGFIVGANT
jgi:hypothetical protein